MATAKKLIQRRSQKVGMGEGLGQFLPTSVQKSYFMLSDADRAVLNTALEKYRLGQAEPILVGGKKMLKPAPGFRCSSVPQFNGETNSIWPARSFSQRRW